MDAQWTTKCPYEDDNSLDLAPGDTGSDLANKSRKIKVLASCLAAKRNGLIQSWPR